MQVNIPKVLIRVDNTRKANTALRALRDSERATWVLGDKFAQACVDCQQKSQDLFATPRVREKAREEKAELLKAYSASKHQDGLLKTRLVSQAYDIDEWTGTHSDSSSDYWNAWNMMRAFLNAQYVGILDEGKVERFGIGPRHQYNERFAKKRFEFYIERLGRWVNTDEIVYFDY